MKQPVGFRIFKLDVIEEKFSATKQVPVLLTCPANPIGHLRHQFV